MCHTINKEIKNTDKINFLFKRGIHKSTDITDFFFEKRDSQEYRYNRLLFEMKD